MMKKAFTLIELMIVLAITAVLTIILLPKITQSTRQAKEAGVHKNQQFLESLVRTTLDKNYYSAPTAEEVVQRTYTQLSNNEDITDMVNPFDKSRKGIGLIEGSTFVDTNKAAYLFTDNINPDTLPEGTVYVVVKDEQLVSNIPEEPQEPQEPQPGELTMVTTVKELYHSLAIGSDGNLYSWGYNNYGQLGVGDKLPRETPTLVTLAEGVKPTALAAKSSYSMALGDDGNIYAWGYNSFGQLGIGDLEETTTPMKVILPGGAKAISIVTNSFSTSAIDSNGNLYNWGNNSSGQLGVEDTYYKETPTLVTLPGGVKFKTATMYYNYMLAIGTDGNLYSWGYNGYGQLGLGDTKDKTTPNLISLSYGVKPVSLAANTHHATAIGDDGNLYAWGNNGIGQLGTGDTTRRTTPTLITLPGNAKPKSVTTGEVYTEVITTTGETILFGRK